MGTFLKLFARVMLVAALAGCATANVKLYPAPSLPGSRIAVIKNNPMIADITQTGVTINRVDGVRVGVTALGVELLPGTYNLDLQCSLRVQRFLLGRNINSHTLEGTIVKQERLILRANVEAGHVYLLRAHRLNNESCRVELSDSGIQKSS